MVEQAATKIQSRHICYVDDSRTSSYVTKRMLEKQGYVVEHFAQAEDALEAVLEKDYDLLLTDLMITTAGDGVNGDDLIRLIRLSGHPVKMKLPIIVVTGVVDKEVLAGLVETGANRVLSKPMDETVLDQTIQQVLDETSQHIISEPEAAQDHTQSDNFLSLRDQLSTQVEKQEERFIPTLTEEVDVEEEPPAKDVSHAISTKFEKREIVPASSAVDIPLIGDLPQTTTEEQKTIQETATVGGRNKTEDTSTTLNLKPLDDFEVPSFLDQVDTRRAKRDDEKEVSQRNDAWSEIESFFEESTSETAHLSEVVEETELDASSLDDILDSAKQNALDQDLPKPDSIASKPDVAEESKPSIEKQPKAEKNPLLDLLDEFDDQGSVGDIEKAPVFKKPGISVKFNPKVTRSLLIALAILLIVPPIFYLAFQESITEVDFVSVEMQPIHESVMVTGRVVSRKQVDVTSYFPGKIDNVKVKEGAFVKKGEVLAVLDGRDSRSRVNRAEAKLISIRENVSLSRKSMERLQRALDKGAVSRQMVEDAEASWKTESAKQSLAEEELKEAKLQVERLQIKAPFSGRVASLEAQEGQWLAPPDPLAKLVDVKNVEVELRVDAADSSSLLEGQIVELSSDAFPGQSWQETITRISSTTDRENRSNFVHVYATLGDQAPSLKVGQQVDAAVRISSNSRALVLPFEAIKQVNGQTMVAVELNGRVHFVPVVTGIESLSHIEITQGLTIGQRVLLPGGLILEEGQKVSFVTN